MADTIRTRVGLVVIAGVLASLLGCDPCSGVLSCAPGPYLALGGRMVEPQHGLPLKDVRIDLVRTGGIDILPESVSTITDADGTWHMALTPQSAGLLLADIRVSAPGTAPYRLRDVALPTRAHRGDGSLNQLWIPSLYVDAVGEFYVAGSDDVRAAGASVEFDRTGGIPLAGPGVHADVWRGTTDAAGHVHFFPQTGDSAVVATEGGTLIGRVTITLANGLGVMVINNVRLGASNLYRDKSALPPVLRVGVPATGRDSLDLSAP